MSNRRITMRNLRDHAIAPRVGVVVAEDDAGVGVSVDTVHWLLDKASQAALTTRGWNGCCMRPSHCAADRSGTGCRRQFEKFRLVGVTRLLAMGGIFGIVRRWASIRNLRSCELLSCWQCGQHTSIPQSHRAG